MRSHRRRSTAIGARPRRRPCPPAPGPSTRLPKVASSRPDALASRGQKAARPRAVSVHGSCPRRSGSAVPGLTTPWFGDDQPPLSGVEPDPVRPETEDGDLAECRRQGRHSPGWGSVSRGALVYSSSTRLTPRSVRGHADAGAAAAKTPSRSVRSLTGVLAAATALGTAVIFAPSASASVASSGPIDPATNFPSTYTDSNGLALELCLGLPYCLADTDLVAVHEAGGDAEAFYYAADATAGPFELHDALEAAYAAGGPDQEMVFQRTQVRAQKSGLPANTQYTVTDPYGTFTCKTGGDGTIGSNGCRTETTPVPGEFGRALNGRIGPFLTWDTGAPAGYIGDNATPHKVLGSPTGFNAFRVQGPGLTGTCAGGTIPNCVESGLFVMQGRVKAGGASASVSAGTLDFGDVPGTPPVKKTLTYANTGSVPITVSSVAVSGADASAFDVQNNCPAAPATLDVGARCTIDVTFTPQPGAASAATLTIADDTPAATRNIALKGSNLGVLTVASPAPPTALAFDNQAVNSASPENNVVIGNTGTGPLTVASATLTGASATHYELGTNGCATPVAPDGGCEIGVVFAPTTTGSKSATLRVTDSNGTVVNVPLSGTGMAGDTTPPTVGTRSPAANATGEAVATNVTAAFSEAVQGISGTTFALQSAAGAAVPAAVSYDAPTRVATLNPNAHPAAGTPDTGTLTRRPPAIPGAAGNALATPQ